MKIMLSIALLAGATFLAGYDEPSRSGIQIFGTVRARNGEPVLNVDRTALRASDGGTFASVVKLKKPHPGTYCVVFDLNDEGEWMFEEQSNTASAVMKGVLSPNQLGDLVLATNRVEMPMRNLSARQIQQRIDGLNLLREANAQGEPPLYTSMHQCIDELARSPRTSGPPVMFVFTGQRGPASAKINDLAQRSIEAGVLIYILHVARNDTANSRTYAILAKAAVGTGGMAFEVTSKAQGESVALDIEDDFVNGYELCYVPSANRTIRGNLHALTVTSTLYKVTIPAAYPNQSSNRACSIQ